jgi:hypothetical protein
MVFGKRKKSSAKTREKKQEKWISKIIG